MKKIIKAVLAAAMMLSVIALNVPEAVPKVSAKVFGDYSYTILEDGTAEITNYGGGEQNLTWMGLLSVQSDTVPLPNVRASKHWSFRIQ